MNLLRKILIVLSAAICSTTNIHAFDEINVKTNALYDATMSLSLGAEMQVDYQWTVELTGSYNGWDVFGNKWRHLIIQPEARYWLNDDELEGSFFAVNVLFGQVNVGNFSMDLFGDKLKNSRVQGWMTGAGLGYGYAWWLSDYWKLEFELTAGVMHFKGDRYSALTGHKIQRNRTMTKFAPTKVALSVVYVF